jgi:hypothetical protein
MANTGTSTLTITTTPQAIVAREDCSLVLVKPDPASASALQKRAPDSGSTAIPYPVGVAVEFQAPKKGLFYRGQTVGYVNTDSGSMTAYQDES